MKDIGRNFKRDLMINNIVENLALIASCDPCS